MQLRSLSRMLASVLFVCGCSDSSGPPHGLAVLAIQSGNGQRALAGTALPTPIVIVPQDQSGGTVVGQTVTFTIIAGGGFLSSSTGQTNPDGTITAPTWTLGKSAVPQQMQVAASGKTAVVDASVQSNYTIAIRFFGRSLPTDQQALFTSAAARVRAIIVGALPSVNAAGVDVSGCAGTTIAPLSGTIDGLVIYASLDSIDGPSKILARAGPCFIREQNGVLDYRTVIGVMEFDTADVVPLVAQGGLENTIVHEMLHVVGFGSFWVDTNLIVTSDTATAAYVGANGVAGCQSVGATATCASSVPIENCVGLANCGAGNIFAHWRETTFRSELMTGFFNTGLEPLSVMTIKSFEDLNYVVNPAAADAYTIAALGALSASSNVVSSFVVSPYWERPLGVAPRALPTIHASSRVEK